jgi:hypothetical protein
MYTYIYIYVFIDSTVDEVKSVGAALSHASVKSNQSISLIEALIQVYAYHIYIYIIYIYIYIHIYIYIYPGHT